MTDKEWDKFYFEMLRRELEQYEFAMKYSFPGTGWTGSLFMFVACIAPALGAIAFTIGYLWVL
jgi:hypothetical protein